MARTRHVIVGGGTAGMNAITTLRQYDRGASEIILVSAERPYARMVLPYYLKGSISESHVYTANPTRLQALGVETAYLGRLCEYAGQCVQTVVKCLGIRLRPTEALEHLGGDELDHQR